MKIYQRIADCIGARARCLAMQPINKEWAVKHRETVDALCRDAMPSGAGFDQGTVLDWDASTDEKLVFHTSFHHMNSAGYYDGWTEHTVTVRPSLAFGFRLTISGQNRNDIKEHIAQAFELALNAEAS